MEGATVHFAAMTTFVAVYIAALYAFLRNAPMAVRVIAYVFFVGSFLVFVRLGIGFFETVNAATSIASIEFNSPHTSDGMTNFLRRQWYDAVPVGLVWYALTTTTVVALGWLTFFFDWKQKGEE